MADCQSVRLFPKILGGYWEFLRMNKGTVKLKLELLSSKTCLNWYVADSRPGRVVNKCTNKNCKWTVGFRLNGADWIPVGNWDTEHIPGCPNNGERKEPSSYLRVVSAKKIWS